QLFDRPAVLDDPIALRIISEEAVNKLRADRRQNGRVARTLRAFMAVRSRFAEDALSRAVQRGVKQYVVLGAGLDTFAYRNPWPQLHVFEVDHPATQEWKKQRLAAGKIAIPSNVTYAPVNFESQTLPNGLAGAGFDPASPAFFSWLGVTMYLTVPATLSTLDYIASTASGGGVAFDYSVPRKSLGFLERWAFDRLARGVARLGEPFQTFWAPADLAEKLRQRGFSCIENLDTAKMNAHHFSNPPHAPPT